MYAYNPNTDMITNEETGVTMSFRDWFKTVKQGVPYKIRYIEEMKVADDEDQAKEDM